MRINNKKRVAVLILVVISLFLIIFLSEEKIHDKKNKLNQFPNKFESQIDPKEKYKQEKNLRNMEKFEKSSESNNQNVLKNTEEKLFKLGKDTFPVMFEDDKLSNTIKHVVINDMNLIFKHLKNYKIVDRSSKIKVNDRFIQSNKGLSFYGKGQYWPDAYNYFGSLIEKNGNYFLSITTHLTDAYKMALSLKNDNKETYKDLNNFIDNYNSSLSKELNNFLDHHNLSLSEGSIEESIDTLFYFYKSASYMKNYFLKKPKKLFKQFNHHRMRKPSLLDLKKSQLNSKNKLIAATYLLDDFDFPILKIYLIYDQNRWKIIIPNYGT